MKFLNVCLIPFFAILGMGCSEGTNEDGAIPNPGTIAVKTFRVSSNEGLEVIAGSGIVSTENEAKYAFKIGGVVDRIWVQESEFFSKGTLLATLKLDEIDAGYMQTKLNVERTERDLQRVTNLYKDSVATLEQLQNAKTAFQIASKQLESVAFDKSYASIYAAHDGFVSKKIVNEGEVVGGGMPVLAINALQGGAWVLKVGLSDRDWAAVQKGNKAEVVLDAFPDKVFTGTVVKKMQVAEGGSGSFQVDIKIILNNDAPAIGMFGRASIYTDRLRKYHTVPYDALIEADGNMAYVYVPLAGSKVKKQAIVFAGFDSNYVKVTAGLEGIDEIVVTNSAFLNEHSIITIIQ